MPDKKLKFRRVASHWKTIEISGFDKWLKDRTPELYVDVWKNENGLYVVCMRQSATINHYNGYVTDFVKCRAASAYALDYAKYLIGEMKARPMSSDMKYVNLDC